MSQREIPGLVPRLKPLGTTVFAHYSAIATETGAINLGQGFPDVDGPSWIADAVTRAIAEGRGNQYPAGVGVLELRKAVVGHQKRWYGIDNDFATEVLITAGATEAVTAALIGLVDTDDEVIVFEPFYDSYRAAVVMARGKLVAITMEAPEYKLDIDAVRKAITPRTKVIVVNTPHNPSGAVTSREELQALADVAIEHNLVVISDEVYEHMAFEGEHVLISSLPGMRERTLTISSAGKLFSYTGGKIGWITGPKPLVDAAKTVKQFLTFVVGGPFQYALAEALDNGDEWLGDLRKSLTQSRDYFTSGLKSLGFEVHQPKGTYFATVDVRSKGFATADEFCQTIPKSIGVVAIPSHVFYEHPERGAAYARFAFCKKNAVLDAALERLAKL